MHVNWMSNSYWQSEGYGRFSSRMAQAMMRQGVSVRPLLRGHLTMPLWMRDMEAVDFTSLTVFCAPPFYLPEYPFPGRLWLLTMTEGSAVPGEWVGYIRDAGIERIIVPCEWNAAAFRAAVPEIPVHVVPGGTDPREFPLLSRNGSRPEAYTFLALGDRGARKGWLEVWQAFYQAFADTPDVKLVVKARPHMNDTLERIAKAANLDPRIECRIEDAGEMHRVYQSVDCVVMPSRGEGWGMPMREAAVMGIPVITTAAGGLDDAHRWAVQVVGKTTAAPISLPFDVNISGEWYLPDVDELATRMRWCYENPGAANVKAQDGALWLRENQTWDHAAAALVTLLEEHGYPN